MQSCLKPRLCCFLFSLCISLQKKVFLFSLGPWYLHAISFEGGLLIFTVPIIAYFLKVDWITAFMMDFSLTVMVTVYTFIFNWVYDHARLLFIKREGCNR